MSLKHRRTSLSTALTSFALALFVSCFPAKGFAQTAASAVPVASRLTQPIDEKQLVPLKGTVHKLATAASDRGAVDDGLALERVQVVLKRSPAQEAALQQTLQGLHQPGSANYHKWLTPAQFGEQFGPSDADIATISSWLGSHGLTVTKVNPGKQTLEFSGSAGQFNKTFHTQIHKYEVNGQVHTANASDPSIPAALAPVFGGFASLNNFPIKSHLKTLGTATYDPATHKATPNWTQGTPGYAPVLYLAPADLAVQYDLNPLYSAGVKGTGVTIGIINESNINLAIAAQYRTLFGLPASPVNVIVDGNDPGIDGVNNPGGPNGASGEAYLDVEQAGAIAPGATIDLIIGGDTELSNGLELAAEHAVYGNVAPVLSLSFGNCESPGLVAFTSGLWEQAAAQGQTVMVSSGDSGSAGCDDDNSQDYAVNGQAVNGFASTPYNVAVGGTDMYFSDYATGLNDGFAGAAKYWNLTPSNATPTVSLNSKAPEQPFNSSQYGLDYFPNLQSPSGPGGSFIFAAGGGASNCAIISGNNCVGIPKPAFQAGAGVPADGVRDLPDVSMFGALYSNLVLTPTCAGDGDCQPVSAGGTVQISGVGGTSVSAPAFAGIMALVNQKYGPQGQADYVLYPLATQFPAVFNDVTVGTNSVPCNIDTTSNGVTPYDCIAVTNPLTVTDNYYGTAIEGEIGSGTTPEYNAGAGYDRASGLGSVDGNALVTNWGSVKFASSSVTLTPSSTSFAHGKPITISGTVTPGTAGGDVAVATTSSEPLQAVETTFAVSGGAYSGTINYLPGGTYQIYGIYSGDGTNGPSTSAKTSITVTPEPSATTLLGLNNVSGTGNPLPNGITLPYGTQIVLEALPGSVIAANTTSLPTGTVTFLNGTSVIGTVPVNAQGEAALNYSPAPSATAYSITAQYSGDPSYSASTSSAVTFTVQKDMPALGLFSSTQSPTAQNVTAVSGASALTVGVENYADVSLVQNYGIAFITPAVAPTGVVTVTGLPSGTLTFPALAATLDPNSNFVEGVATLSLPTETPGTYPVTVSYPGDANYASASIQTSVTITASTLIPTTTTATALAAATSASTPEAVTFTVTGTTAGGAPTGSVSFLVSGLSFGSLPLNTKGAGVTASSVTETIYFNGLTGANQIVVQYSGSSVYAPSQANVSITNANGSLQLVSSGGIPIAAPGGTGTSTITATLGGGLAATGVTLSCSVSAGATQVPTNADLPTCSVGSLTATSSSTATATLTVNTTAATTGALDLPKLPWAPVGGGVAMAGLLFLILPAKRRKLGSLLGALVLVAFVGFSSGCGGGGSSPAKQQGNPGTPAGAYTVTVTGTGGGVTATTSVVVTVQ